MDESNTSPQPPVDTPQTPSRGATKPPRSVSGGLIAVVVAVGVLALSVGMIWGDELRGGGQAALKLVGLADAADDGAHDHAYYTCGMHPWVVLPEPGVCPICQMDLVQLDPAKFSSEVTIDPTVVQNMGVRVEEVTTGPLMGTVRTVGTVTYDETRVREVTTKFDGWIETLFVDSLGTQVADGDPLFTVYSPQVYAAQEEYLSAHRNHGGTNDNTLLEAAHTRLSFFDLDSQQIEELEQRDQPLKAVTIRSPYEGVVIDKQANEGMKVNAGNLIYRIADLSRLWVMVTVYEYQLPYVEVGQKAAMTLPYIPGQTFEGEVTYIYPYLNTRSREARVRLEFANPHGVLKPGMFANVELHNTLAKDRVLVPRSAVLDTGQRQVAFVWLGDGRFEPRDLTLGIEMQAGQVEVLAGLEAGEQVVTSGQFLLDSESKVREALAKMVQDDLAMAPDPNEDESADDELVALPETAAEALADALKAYFAASEELINDQMDGLAEAGESVGQALDRMTQMPVPNDPHLWHRLDSPAKAKAAAEDLVAAESIEEARLALADLSIAMQRLVETTGVPAMIDQSIESVRCPMYLSGQGGSRWLQPAGPVRNPYMGQRMLGCYDERTTLPKADTPSDDASDHHAH